MKNILARTLSAILAMMCALSMTTVSMAAQDENEAKQKTFFDESTCTLYINSDEDFVELFNSGDLAEIYGMEIPGWFVDNYKKIKNVYIGKDFQPETYEVLLSYLIYFPNIEEITVDEENPKYNVFDNALYSEDYSFMMFYPPYCEDVNIILHENTQYLYYGMFYDYEGLIFTGLAMYPATDKEYNLYITRPGQLGEIFNYAYGWDDSALNLCYLRYANIYANETQETIDNLCIVSDGYTFTADHLFNEAIINACNNYFAVNNYYNDDICPKEYERFLTKMQSLIEEYENLDSLPIEEKSTAYEKIVDKQVDFCIEEISSNNYTREDFDKHIKNEYSVEQILLECYGNADAAYEAYVDILNSYEEHINYLYNRGNPIKPVSSLTAGTCGEGTEWTIDRENGTLSFIGTGAITDNAEVFGIFKDAVRTIEIDNGITAIGENMFNGFDAAEQTVYNGTQSEWEEITIAEGNESVLKNVKVIPDTEPDPETPETPDIPEGSDTTDEPAEKTFGDRIAEFFKDISDKITDFIEWIVNLFNF